MAYIGNTQLNQNYVPAVDFFSGNGSTTAFTLSRPVASVAAVQAVISNVPQNPGSAFTVSGSTITFTSAPPSGTNNIYVYYTSPNTQIVQPGQGTVYPASLSTGGPYWNTSGNVGIGTSSPSYKLDVRGVVGFGDGANGAAYFNGGATAYAGLYLQYAGTTKGMIRGDGSGGALVFSGSGTTEQMRIDSSGNVGIGTSSPSAKLDVYNSAAAAVGNEVLRLRYTTATSNATGDINFTNSSGTALNKISSICTSGSTVDLGFSVYNSGITEALRLDSSGNLKFNSGYGSVATAYGCRAWVNFNGTGTVAIRASGNVSSITDNGDGDYTVNFTTAMPDTNYSTSGSASSGASDFRTLVPAFGAGWTYSTSAVRVGTAYQTGLADCANVYVVIHR